MTTGTIVGKQNCSKKWNLIVNLSSANYFYRELGQDGLNSLGLNSLNMSMAEVSKPVCTLESVSD